MNKLLCVAYISCWAGIAINSVGRVSETCQDPYPAYMPIIIILVFAVPAILGYLAGREEVKK